MDLSVMESPSRALTVGSIPSPTHTRSGSIRRRRRSSSESANSPEFEFWRLGPNNTLPQPELHSADELFSDGFLLPLHLLHLDNHHHPSDPEPEPGPPADESDPTNSASITSAVGNPILTASKRWREIFKRGDKKPTSNPDEVTSSKREKSAKKRDKKNGSGNSNPAELNINIWPFSRSRSAGNNSGRAGSRPSSNRKVSSAPCSRSNSSGESKSSRKSWPNSPGRTGVHLGRTSPVWQARPRNRPATCDASKVGKGRVLNLNVPMCMGYRQQMSCRSDEHGGVGDGGAGRSGGGGSGNNGNLFGLRGLFSKKSVLTV